MTLSPMRINPSGATIQLKSKPSWKTENGLISGYKMAEKVARKKVLNDVETSEMLGKSFFCHYNKQSNLFQNPPSLSPLLKGGLGRVGGGGSFNES